MTDLMSPLVFTEAEIGKFIRDNVCLYCLGTLVARPLPDRKYGAVCLEHGPIMDWNYTNKHLATTIKTDRLLGALDLEPEKPPRPPAEVLRELGF